MKVQPMHSVKQPTTRPSLMCETDTHLRRTPKKDVMGNMNILLDIHYGYQLSQNTAIQRWQSLHCVIHFCSLFSNTKPPHSTFSPILNPAIVKAINLLHPLPGITKHSPQHPQLKSLPVDSNMLYDSDPDAAQT
jgi:hypothetical protein